MSTNITTNQAAAANDTPSILGKRKRDSNSQCHYERDAGRECTTKRRINPKKTELAISQGAAVHDIQSVLGKRKRDENSQYCYEKDAGRVYSPKRRMSSEWIKRRRQIQEQEYHRLYEADEKFCSQLKVEEDGRRHEQEVEEYRRLEQEQDDYQRRECRRQMASDRYATVLRIRNHSHEKLTDPRSLSPWERGRHQHLFAQTESRFIITAPHGVTRHHRPERCGICRDQTCSICLDAFVVGQPTSWLRSCNHYFHGACINPWFRISKTCPICFNHVYNIQPFIDRYVDRI